MDMVIANDFFYVMICFHDPTDNQPFISMDLHQVAMANTFQPTQIGTSQPEVGAKNRLGKIYLNPPRKKESTWYSMEPEKITPASRKENHLH